MAFNRSMGMLSGDPRYDLGAPTTSMQVGQQLGSMFGRGLNIAAGRDVRSAEQIQTQKTNEASSIVVKALASNDVETMKQAAETVAALGDREGAMQLVKAIRELQEKTEDPYAKYRTVGNYLFDMDKEEWVVKPDGSKQEAGTETKTISMSDARQLYKDGVITRESLAEFVKGGGKDSNLLDFTAEAEEYTVDRYEEEFARRSSVINKLKELKTLAPDSGTEAVLMKLSAELGLPTKGFTTEQLLSTIKANFGFDELQKMRDNSKTGGALGQVTELELKLLQDSVTSLDIRDPMFKTRLDEAISEYQRILQKLEPKSVREQREADIKGSEGGTTIGRFTVEVE